MSSAAPAAHPADASAGGSPRGPVLVFVADARIAIERLVVVARAAGSTLGASLVVQVRDKGGDPRALEARARALAVATAETGAALVVPGDHGVPLELAVSLGDATGRCGVHLPGRASLPARAFAARVAEVRAATPEGTWLSAAAHDDDDVRLAVDHGVDAVLVSPVFTTPGKGEARGTASLTRARALAGGKARVYALGGVDAERVASCAEAGADGAAVIRALVDAAQPGLAALALAAPFARGRAGA